MDTTVATRLPVSVILTLEGLVMLAAGAALFGWGAISSPVHWWAIAVGTVLFWNSIGMAWLAARAHNMERHPLFAVTLIHTDRQQ